MPSTSLAVPDGFTAADQKAAKHLAASVDRALAEAHAAYDDMMTGFVKVGLLLQEVQKKQYWRLWGHASFGQYIVSLEDRVAKGRTQLYQAISTTEKLLPYIDGRTLERIGISKAIELKPVIAAGRRPSEGLIAKAADRSTKISELRAAVYAELHIDPKQIPRGTYWDWGGCHLEPEERKTIQQAFDLARRQEPPISQKWPEHLQRKEIMLRMAQECISSWVPLVRKGKR